MRKLTLLPLLLCCQTATPPPPTTKVEPDRPAVLGDLSPFTSTEEAESFDRETLYTAINGAAEVYLAYGFERLLMREYAEKDLTIRVMLFDMGRPLFAFGVFKKEQPSKGKTLAVGTSAIAWPPVQCLLFKSRFYVKVDALEGELDEQSCTSVLQKLADGLPGKASPPTELSLLPSATMENAQFVPSGFLGLSELTNALQTKIDGKELTVFAITADVDTVWKTLEGKWETISETTRAREVPYRGWVAVKRTARGLIGVAEAGDKDATLNALAEID